mgnify:CR=1 FL=1
MVGYTNANWVGSLVDRRSMSGYMLSLGSEAVTWSNEKQPMVTLSNIEVDYKGATISFYGDDVSST